VLLFRMDGLITALLKLSRLDADVVEFHQEKVNLQELIDRSLRPFLVTLDLHEIQVERAVHPRCRFMAIQSGFQKQFRISSKIVSKVSVIKEKSRSQQRRTPCIRNSRSMIQARDLKHRTCDRCSNVFTKDKTVKNLGLESACPSATRLSNVKGGRSWRKNHPDGGALFVLRFPK
jgi:hypothetical protein